MALTLQIQTDEVLQLDEFMEVVDREIDREDFESLVDGARLLKKLANNRCFLIDHVNGKLLQSGEEDSHDAGDTSFLFGRRDRLWVRANIWIPPREMPLNGPWRANAAAYLMPHDHHFSFVTVGYFGSGYETSIFEYDRSRVEGRPGEHVELQFLEKTRLAQGKVMVYRASKDVHYQAHPQDFSISLNLLLFPREYRDQYVFDVKRSQIALRAHDFRRQQGTMCKLAAVLGNTRTANVLERVSHENRDEEIRLSAFQAWSSLERDRALDIWRIALSDAHPSVRGHAHKTLADMQA